MCIKGGNLFFENNELFGVNVHLGACSWLCSGIAARAAVLTYFVRPMCVSCYQGHSHILTHNKDKHLNCKNMAVKISSH